VIGGTVIDTVDDTVIPPRWWRRVDTGDLVAIGILVVAFLVPLRGLLRIQGPPMEEGFMLVFPERVLHGAIPNKDFWYPYGPGSLWVLAGVFKVFGTSLTVERLVGLLQQMAIVFGVFALARRWGRAVALGCGLLALLFIVPTGLTALAWVGAVGLGLLGLVAGVASRDTTSPRRGERLALLAGVLVGFALLNRIDLVVAIGLSVVALGWGARRTLQRRFAIGLGAGLVPYVIHLATAGPDNVIRGMITDPFFKLRGGARLPIPPSWNRLDGTLERFGNLVSLRWPLPTVPAPAQLTIWFFVLLASVSALAVTGIWAVRRDPTSLRPRVLLAVAGFSLGIVPQTLQRADSVHLAWVSCVAMAFVPVAALEILHAHRPHWPTRTIGVAITAVLFVVTAAVIPNYTVRLYTDYSEQTFGNHYLAHGISHRGRGWYTAYASDATPTSRLLDTIERISEPGQRLFVGPQDLRKTPYSDAFFYYLLPQLTPGTYYIAMAPGLTNATDSGLADEVGKADLLILSTAWSNWDEPNDSRKLGPDAPNQIVRTQFCLVASFEPHYKLYRHCHR
jgi:hypothetical protein